MLAAGVGAEEYMRQVRIELTTLGLWDLRAASCATAALVKIKITQLVYTQDC